MNKKISLLSAAALVLLALAAGFFSIRRQVTLTVDGQARRGETYAWTVAEALAEAGIPLSMADYVSPSPATLLGLDTKVEVKTAKVVAFWSEGQGVVKTIRSAERSMEAWMKAAEVSLKPGEILLYNGKSISGSAVLPEADAYVLQIVRQKSLNVVEGSQQRALQSAAASIGQALWQAGVQVSLADVLSLPYSTLHKDAQTETIQRAKTIRVSVDGKELSARTGAATVGEALKEVGLALQGLDYSQPAENQPIPASGAIRVVRVVEKVELKQTAIAYKSELVADPELELDQRRVIQAGREGLKVSRILIRLEDGKEVNRATEAEWTAAEPQNQKNGYGTKIVIRTLDTPDGPIQYWRSARVYATSFAPCNFLLTIGRCSYTTANGMTLKKGIVGMGEVWYNLMVNQGVYVEGYGKGVVADYGYVGGYWVDLGFSDADFVNWHRNTTLYWLTPVPANIPWILPP